MPSDSLHGSNAERGYEIGSRPLFDSSDHAIVSKNLSGIIQTWNAGAQAIFGYTAEEAASITF
jgi:PAS domain-containing protein